MKRGQIVRVKSTGHVGVIEGFVTYSANTKGSYVRFPDSDKPDELYQFRTESLEIVPDAPGVKVGEPMGTSVS